HDLGVIAETVDRVVVLYGGKVMETGPVEAIFEAPLHPYTRALLNSIPGQTAGKQRLTEIPGASPNPAHPPAGCPFHPRCPMAIAECQRVVPPLEAKAPGRLAACIRVEPALVPA
ncbi:MAG TPA: oligopeptide/dipeptide ABC transporter ATP-binding protein, partial [Devosia sp.]|nr:oligopeptide/dipeptide ABC transporter ATP-binding protein [Devosia sp.]